MWPLISARLRRSAEITWLLVGHAPNLGADPIRFLWQLRHNTGSSTSFSSMPGISAETVICFSVSATSSFGQAEFTNSVRSPASEVEAKPQKASSRRRFISRCKVKRARSFVAEILREEILAPRPRNEITHVHGLFSKDLSGRTVRENLPRSAFPEAWSGCARAPLPRSP